MNAVLQHFSTHLLLNVNDYPGGVAIWGALPAVFDTSCEGFDHGVHVHARLEMTSKKSIDATYQVVETICANDVFKIDETAAVHFSMASIFTNPIISLDCAKCSRPITSLGFAAVLPAYEHPCQYCGHVNATPIACVINPIMALKERLGDASVQRPAVVPDRMINIELADYPGGVQIWGSNPSILWTAHRLEESAIHVHAYNHEGKRVVDNTFGRVTLAGQELDIDMIRVLQIQQALPGLLAQITTVYCPECGISQFDQGQQAVIAHTDRTCLQCHCDFTQPPVISNPVWQQLKSTFENFSHE
jgi:hypothetical protein